MGAEHSHDHSPPRIEGFDHVKLIGSGGFAAVHLYQQRRPSRRVAVKVVHATWSDRDRTMFEAEADLMASLSSHPFIVTLYQAGMTDNGRPYLAMEYCSRLAYGTRYRTERFTVPDVLRTGVQLAGAVETAHRAGILHRDIKPANVLVTDYGHPALTDFGISVTLDDVGRAEGMSVPWSPPESFADVPVTGVATDVWALAATLYTLLAQRSPFEVPGGSNTTETVMRRITVDELPPIGRPDVPRSLELVLATAMAKHRDARWPSALELARALQQVEAQESLAVTPVDVLDAPVTPAQEPAPLSTAPQGAARREKPRRPAAVVVPAVEPGAASPATARLLDRARRRAVVDPWARPEDRAVPAATVASHRATPDGGQ